MHVSSLFSSSQLCRLESGCLITVKYSAILPISCVDQRVDGLCGVVLGVCSVQAPCRWRMRGPYSPSGILILAVPVCGFASLRRMPCLPIMGSRVALLAASSCVCVCLAKHSVLVLLLLLFFEKKHSVLVSLPFSIIDTCMRHGQLDFIHGEGTVHVDMESFSLATKYYISRNIITYYARGSETSSAHKKIYCIIFHASPEYANASVRSSDIHYNNDQAVLCDINH